MFFFNQTEIEDSIRFPGFSDFFAYLSVFSSDHLRGTERFFQRFKPDKIARKKRSTIAEKNAQSLENVIAEKTLKLICFAYDRQSFVLSVFLSEF